MKWIVRVITAAVLYAASVQTAQACWGELTCEKTADTGEITSYPAIVNYRVANGMFVSVDELRKVQGFNESDVDAVRSSVTVE